MSKVIEFKRPTANDQAGPFPWLVYSKELPCQTVQATNPFEAMERAQQKGLKGPLTFTCVIPADDDMEWLNTWDIPPMDWTTAREAK